MNDKQEQLADLFRNMDPDQYQEIRDAYYKAAEGLATLAKALEIADAQQTQSAGPLLDEHFIATAAVEVLNKSDLGRIL